MQSADRPAFMSLLTDAMAFYRQDVSDFAIGVWWQACQGFGLDDVRRAMTQHAMDPERGQFAPKPADIVRQLRGTQSDRSLIAWGKVMDAIRRVGAYRSVVFDDGAIHCAIEDMGGWPAVCRSTEDELPFLQKRFCDLHRAYSARSGHPHPPRLVGEHERQNRLNGFDVAAPTLIGNPQQAQRVEQLGSSVGKTQVSEALPEPAALRRIGKDAA